MLTTLRRFLAVVALMFWQGGFTFYAAVVVPTGQRVLGSHLEQGLITREVTWYLNVAGAAALALLAYELQSSGYPRCTAFEVAAGSSGWGWQAVCWLKLLLAHPALNALLDVDAHSIVDRGQFRPRHRMYLWISTLQWLLGGAYLWMMLLSWRKCEVEKGSEEKNVPLMATSASPSHRSRRSARYFEFS